MIPSESIKPISYFKSHASEIIRDIAANKKTMIITQNGEAKAIIQDIKLFEEMHETLALLKILSLGSKSLNDGKFRKIDDSFKALKNEIEKEL